AIRGRSSSTPRHAISVSGSRTTRWSPDPAPSSAPRASTGGSKTSRRRQGNRRHSQFSGEILMLKTICIWTAIILGIGAEANALFMLYSPADWYLAVPGVTTTGPFNQHFIRDIGLIYLFVGTALLVGTFRPQHRILLWTTAALW